MRSVPSSGRCRTAAGRLDRAIGPTWRRLPAALEVSETTATVLVRRGLHDPDEARAFLAVRAARPRSVPARRHGARRRTAPGRRRGRRAHLRPRRLRRRRDLGDGRRRPRPARARREGGVARCRAGSRRGTGSLPRRSTRLAADGVDLVLTVDCGITAVEEVARAKELGLDVIVTDHHRPGETLPDCPVVATRPSHYPCPDLCGTGRRLHARAGAPRPRPARPSTRTLDLVALATIADVVPLVDENRALAAAGLRALARTRRPGPPGAHAVREGRPGGGRRDGGRVPARAADQRGGAARSARPRARPPPDGRPRGGRRARGAARGAQPRAAGRGGADPPRGDGARRRAASRRARAPRLRALGRGLARGRDRHRRLAARRAVPPAGRADREERRELEGLRPLDPRVRSPRRARGVRGATCTGSAAIARPPGSRSRPRGSRRSRTRSAATPTRSSRRSTCDR